MSTPHGVQTTHSRVMAYMGHYKHFSTTYHWLHWNSRSFCKIAPKCLFCIKTGLWFTKRDRDSSRNNHLLNPDGAEPISPRCRYQPRAIPPEYALKIVCGLRSGFFFNDYYCKCILGTSVVSPADRVVDTIILRNTWAARILYCTSHVNVMVLLHIPYNTITPG